jgi:hypothetical protein
MKCGLAFTLPEGPRGEKVLERLREAFDLLNEDKEEQAIDPDLFYGNLKDYPEWIAGAFGKRDLVEQLEKFCEFEPGELGEWDLEGWYEDLISCECWDFRLHKRRDGRHEVVYRVEREHYGGDMSHAWIVLAAGATAVQCLPLDRSTEE